VFYALGLAICIDYIVGWPNKFVNLIGHPVIFIGRAISWFEKYFNSGSKVQKIICGGLSTLLLIAFLFICLLHRIIHSYPYQRLDNIDYIGNFNLAMASN